MTEERRSLAPVVIGIALTAILLLLLGYLTNKRGAELQQIPRLQMVTPADGASVDSPLVVVFTSSKPLQLSNSGWSIGALHLHAWLNDVQYMPAAADIRRLPDGTYQWALPAAARAMDQQLHLGWANAAHQPVPEGSTPAITITVR